MKKIKFILLFVALATFMFTSCKEEKDVFVQDQSGIQSNKKNYDYTYEEIDLMSQEIASFHNDAINYFLSEMYKPNDVLDKAYMLNLKKEMLEQANNYEFKYLNKEYIKDDLINDEDFLYICMGNENGFNFSKLDKYNEQGLYDIKMIESLSNECVLKLQSLLYDSETPEEFEMQYNTYVSEVLSKVTDKNNYMCIRFYADMYMSSFITWSNYLYGGNEEVTKGSRLLGSAWTYLKKGLKEHGKEIWNEVGDVVAIDAGGAVTGAMAGSAIGGVGAGPGAVVTGASCSAGECVRRIIKR